MEKYAEASPFVADIFEIRRACNGYVVTVFDTRYIRDNHQSMAEYRTYVCKGPLDLGELIQALAAGRDNIEFQSSVPERPARPI